MSDDAPWNCGPAHLAALREQARRAATYLASMQYRLAAEAFTEAAAAEPVHPKLYHWRRVAFRGLGREADALGDERVAAERAGALLRALEARTWPPFPGPRVREKLRCLGWLRLEGGWELRAPLAEGVLADFERRYGVTLPAEYRSFVAGVGDGGPGPGSGLAPFECAYDEGWADRGDVCRPFSPEGAGVNDGCIVLSYDGCDFARSFFLVVTGGERGGVWEDRTWCAGGALEATGLTFPGWYERWLDGRLHEWVTGRGWESPCS